MNPKEHRKDFNRIWKSISSDSYEKAFKKFKIRIINVLTRVIREEKLKNAGVDYFCQHYGIVRPSWGGLSSHPIMKRLCNEKHKKNFYLLVEVICLSLRQELQDNLQNRRYFGEEEWHSMSSEEQDEAWRRAGRYFTKEEYSSIVQKMQEAVEMSDVNVISSLLRDGRIILYPKGEPKLDEELVNKTLSFLNEKSNNHFEEALKFCQKREPVKSAESLRRALEEFLRHKLKNKKGLKENIKTLRENLKKAGSPAEIRNIFHKIFEIFDCLDKYFNDNSKHGDRSIPEPENEFLIYQTGLLLRYINAFDLTQNQKAE